MEWQIGLIKWQNSQIRKTHIVFKLYQYQNITPQHTTKPIYLPTRNHGILKKMEAIFSKKKHKLSWNVVCETPVSWFPKMSKKRLRNASQLFCQRKSSIWWAKGCRLYYRHIAKIMCKTKHLIASYTGPRRVCPSHRALQRVVTNCLQFTHATAKINHGYKGQLS